MVLGVKRSRIRAVKINKVYFSSALTPNMEKGRKAAALLLMPVSAMSNFTIVCAVSMQFANERHDDGASSSEKLPFAVKRIIAAVADDYCVRRTDGGLFARRCLRTSTKLLVVFSSL